MKILMIILKKNVVAFISGGFKWQLTVGLCDALEFEIQMLKIYTNEKW